MENHTHPAGTETYHGNTTWPAATNSSNSVSPVTITNATDGLAFFYNSTAASDANWTDESVLAPLAVFADSYNITSVDVGGGNDSVVITDVQTLSSGEWYANLSAIFFNNLSQVSQTPNGEIHALSLSLTLLIHFSSGFASLLTFFGNLLVLVSVKLDRRLQTVTNLFLVSLAVSDMIVGIFSIPLYTVYLTFGYWPLGPTLCDLWLTIDYALCTTSMWNIVVISIDRFLSVTRPMSYRCKRTARLAICMILPVWIVPLIAWGIAIIGYPHFVGKRTLAPTDCQLPFIADPLLNSIIAITVYSVPTVIMLVVCVTIYRETSRFNVRKVQSRDTSITTATTTTTTPLTSIASTPQGSCQDFRSSVRGYRHMNGQKPREGFRFLAGHRRLKETPCKNGVPEINIMVDDDGEYDEQTGRARETKNPGKHNARKCISDPTSLAARKRRNGSRAARDRSRDNCNAIPSTLAVPQKQRPSSLVCRRRRQQSSLRGSYRSHKPRSHSMGSLSRGAHPTLTEKGSRLPMLGSVNLSHRMATLNRDRKALKTLGVIIFTFLLFWTPYHVLVVWLGICNSCVDDRVYAFSYYLCYLNSTFNPWVYAFCNKTFKETYIRILSCRRRKFFEQPEGRCSFRMIDEDNSQF